MHSSPVSIDKRVVSSNIVAGTSMSCPHASSAAANAQCRIVSPNLVSVCNEVRIGDYRKYMKHESPGENHFTTLTNVGSPGPTYEATLTAPDFELLFGPIVAWFASKLW
ncbi:hypothetical protein IFM89_000625, partial [Coptis chinensis]